MKIGIGYDIHRLEKGRPLILGGVTIPFEKGLLGHSDADVLIHAIMDSMLGAINSGNIGVLFPPGDDKWKDRDSLELLKIVFSKISDASFAIGNIDSVIICEQPKLNNYLDDMKQNIAQVLNIEKGIISIKATTNEGLGVIGESKAIAAKAVCLLKEKGLKK